MTCEDAETSDGRRRPQGLVLGNAAAGAEKQALALAAAVGLPHTINRALPSALARFWLPTGDAARWLLSRLGGGALGLAAARAVPLLAISCGRAAIASSVALRAASGGRTLTVHVQLAARATRRSSTSSSRRRTTLRAVDWRPAAGRVPDRRLAARRDARRARRRARRAEAAALAALPRPRLAVLLGGPTTARWWRRPRAPS